ncbi:glutamine--tRNA ligase/YqeY domain fusion protein [Pseudohongiella sp. SYSU M77423]|uniref:glutamine--tRNA ligase/YqeY domain fusion protein n=1 Tax=Pseudohongiella sp. SYSU M77423 TaxID=3042312 RepID=UPI002480AAE5|nr:glutamine--tRNA ligase/YqeY domain fusion protein [Pseudohongiella sp. SYSU M77423]MDH7945118.1 glutamine--tRNA ligase/YqeY domain fusion protein [Pseudohongiella sp. SYSU M77423]MEC8860802.1 glutamine--tRNA ligase/YqeY domain fusion protein [Pseudomonadota bacterium]
MTASSPPNAKHGNADKSHNSAEAAGKSPSHFIRHMIEQDLGLDKHNGRVQTRFPPEPNGFLHIGHAKSICLNFGLAQQFKDRARAACNLRFDDTNPAKESQEFIDAIKADIEWLGFEWNGEVRYTSSYFQHLYDFALQLIRNGKAYVCSLTPDEAREYRGTLTEPGRNSPYRERSVDENLDLFQRMQAGEFADGEHSLRAKIDMASPNINMRDPVIYRIRKLRHHQTADSWNVYPMYDYAHCISDALEHITHSLCTLEFEDHRPLYDWILVNLEPESLRKACHALGNMGADEPYVLPQQTEFARLNINYTVMSKRKLKEMVELGLVSGWDDPRMPTLSGLRRRGYTPAAIRHFCDIIGMSRSESIVDVGMLEHSIRDDLDTNAPRAMCVLRPLKVTLTNYPDDKQETLSLPCHPKNDMGHREIPFGKTLYIDRSDFEQVPPPGFKRLSPEREVRLRGAYVIRCDEVITDDSGEVVELHCHADLDTLGKNPEGRKVKGVIHWVPAESALAAEVRIYDRLFNNENPDDKSLGDFKNSLNPDSLQILTGCLVEPSLASAAPEASFQFEREGYFCVDRHDSRPDRLVFNRTVSLRDSWGKQNG